MEIYTASPIYWEPLAIVENFSSVIWTEKFRGIDECKMVLPMSVANEKLITTGSYLRSPDSSTIMQVRTRSIDTDDSGNTNMTIVAEGLEGIFQRTPALLDPNRGLPYVGYPPDWAAFDLTRYIYVYGRGIEREFAILPETDVRAINIRPGVGTTIPENRYYPGSESLWSAIEPLLEEHNAGVSTVAYYAPSPTKSTTFLFRGPTDRTTGTNAIVFDVDNFDISNTSYLDTNDNYRTGIVVESETGHRYFLKRGSASGWNLETEIVKLDQEITTAAELLIPAQTHMNRHVNERHIDGVQVQSNRYIYRNSRASTGNYYALGDLVRVEGEYGFSETMQVTEYIRVMDSEGYRGYPTLSRYST